MRAFGRKEELTKGSRNYVSINSNQVYLSTRKGKKTALLRKSGLSQTTGDDLELFFLPKNILMHF